MFTWFDGSCWLVSSENWCRGRSLRGSGGWLGQLDFLPFDKILGWVEDQPFLAGEPFETLDVGPITAPDLNILVDVC